MNINKGVDYMCNNNEPNTCENCIADILKVILLLQQRVCPNDTCLQTCDRPVLGGGSNCLICNTRPVMLYTCCGNGTPWSMPISKDVTADCSGQPIGGSCSTVFRVEKIEGCCATFRVLQENPDPTSLNPYVSTNSFFTMNCNCICAIKCLSDTFVDCVC